ncbi:hypothetical protein IT575_05750 [bacterium]|nr:hypothetical protein [bacterium]
MSEFENKPVTRENEVSLREEERLRELLAGLDSFIVATDEDDDEDWDDEDEDWDDDDEDEDWDDEDEDWEEDDE